MGTYDQFINVFIFSRHDFAGEKAHFGVQQQSLTHYLS
jgi:hypothetical protein